MQSVWYETGPDFKFRLFSSFYLFLPLALVLSCNFIEITAEHWYGNYLNLYETKNRFPYHDSLQMERISVSK